MNIKKGDKVQVISGKDKGKSAAVIRALPEKDMVILDGLNKKKRHVRKQGSQKGAIVERSHPIHISNVMLLDGKGKPTRVAKTFDEKKKKWVRSAVTTKATI